MNNRFGKYDEYGLRHLPGHLMDAELGEKLRTILTNLEFIESKCAEGLTYALIDDYDDARKKMPAVFRM